MKDLWRWSHGPFAKHQCHIFHIQDKIIGKHEEEGFNHAVLNYAAEDDDCWDVCSFFTIFLLCMKLILIDAKIFWGKISSHCLMMKTFLTCLKNGDAIHVEHFFTIRICIIFKKTFLIFMVRKLRAYSPAQYSKVLWKYL